MRILGIDPGLATIGWGVIDTTGVKHKAVAYGAITTPALTPTEKRLSMIYAKYFRKNCIICGMENLRLYFLIHHHLIKNGLKNIVIKREK